LSEPFYYDVPNSNLLYLRKGDLTNKTLIEVVWYIDHPSIYGYDDIVGFELYARENNSYDALQLV
jgi:hypothetical protein